MAESCPNCGAPVEHDFGVTPCEKCGVILFVDFNGEVQISNPAIKKADELPVEFLAEPIHDESSIEFAGDNPFEIPADDFAALAQEEIVEETTEEFTEEIAEEASEEESAIEAPAPSVEGDWFEQTLDQNLETTSGVAAPPLNDGILDFSDVVDFANRGELDNSPLVYRLRIEGIDHKDIRRKVESVLADPKLNFHLKDILPLIKGGALELHDLPPVKASVIASRLRDESVQFHWTQSAFQSDSEGGALGETGT